MVQLVKAGQRNSVPWNNAWASYVLMNGNGYSDPARYESSFITGFLDYVGGLAEADLSNQMPDDGSGQQKRPAIEAGLPGEAPPAKRVHMAAQNASLKARLVDRVKALQRSDPVKKEAWWELCDKHYEGRRDPGRHNVETLEEFLSAYEIEGM